MVRDTSPARYMGRVSASELDLEMIVLSRSKKAASTTPMVGHATDGVPEADERGAKDLRSLVSDLPRPVPRCREKSCENRLQIACLPDGDLGTLTIGAETHSPPCAFCGSSSTPPEEPYAR